MLFDSECVSKMKKPLTLILFLLLTFSSFADKLPREKHEIKIHFLHGSKPKKGYKSTESKAFGGIHGGHVTLEVDGMEYGFNPSQIPVHIFPKKKKLRSSFDETQVSSKENGARKYTSISMEIDHEKYLELKSILREYLAQSPYDYAFFGMRCAASTRDILEQLDVLKDRSNFNSIRKAFYPKRLRKELLKMVDEKGFKVHRVDGRTSRKWERE